MLPHIAEADQVGIALLAVDEGAQEVLRFVLHHDGQRVGYVEQRVHAIHFLDVPQQQEYASVRPAGKRSVVLSYK